MQFTLTYDGDLKTGGRGPDVQRIREALHPQLKDLWTCKPLCEALGPRGFFGAISTDCSIGGQHFRTLVHDDLLLGAHLDILMLKAEPPGSVVKQQGDIDNRLKTLFDGLSAPVTAQQVQPSQLGVTKDDPVYVLLQDDKLITRVNVETDRFLGAPYSDKVRLIIRVTLRASSMIWANMPLLA